MIKVYGDFNMDSQLDEILLVKGDRKAAFALPSKHLNSTGLEIWCGNLERILNEMDM